MNLYRLALTFSPTPEVQAALEKVEAKARPILFETHLKKARTCEEADQWRQAAEHYGKAHAARPAAALAERHANALRRNGSDLHRAAQLGEEAVQKEPKNAEYRLTLAEVYFAAGLYLRAKGELSRALEHLGGGDRAVPAAKGELSRALEIAPHSDRGRELKAKLQKVAREPKKA
jgi:tetratricopeptide (TPR) repeat protein